MVGPSGTSSTRTLPERRRRRAQQETSQFPSSRSVKRKRKKRKKRRPLRTPAHSSSRFARRRRRRWHAPVWFSSVHAMFPSHVGKPKLLGVMDGMEKKYFFHRARSSTLAVAYAGLVLLVAPCTVFPVVVHRPETLCIMADIDQKPCIALFSGSGMCKVGSTRYSAPRAVCISLLLSGPDALHLGRYGPDSYVMVLMVQTEENCGVSAVAVHQGRRPFLRGAQADSHGRCDR